MFAIRLTLTAVVAALVAPAAAAGADCTLTFSARLQQWNLDGCREKTDTDLNGTPTIFVNTTTPVNIVVVDANPLLYIASIGTVTTAKIEASESLQTLFLGFGGVFKEIVGAMVSKATPDPKAGEVPRPPLAVAIALLKADLEQFLREEITLITAVQRLEFADRVTVGSPTTTLETWTTRFTLLRSRLEDEEALIKVAGHDASKVAGPEARKEAAALLEKAGTILKAVSTAKLVARRACVAAARTCTGEPAGSVTVERRIPVWTGTRAAAWDEIATYPLTVARQSLYAGSVVTDMPEKVETTFRIGSRSGSLFGTGLGLTSSNIADPTFAAVGDPASPDKKVVTQTRSSQRSAMVTLLGTYAFTHKTEDWSLRPLLEFGTALDTDRPGAFVGAALGIGRYLRFAAGVTRQRVKALDGQTADVTVVTDDKAIRTHDVWENGKYWSVSFNITGLPLFSKGK